MSFFSFHVSEFLEIMDINMRNPYSNKLPKSHVRWIVVSIFREFNVIDKVNCDVIKLNSISYNWEFIKRNFAKYNLRYNKEKNVATAYQHGMPLPPVKPKWYTSAHFSFSFPSNSVFFFIFPFFVFLFFSPFRNLIYSLHLLPYTDTRMTMMTMTWWVLLCQKSPIPQLSSPRDQYITIRSSPGCGSVYSRPSSSSK